jgi:hypothetical protein
MHIAASTLYDFVQCPTRVGLDAFGDPAKRDPINPFVRLLWERGTLFERETIAKLDQPFTDLSGFKEEEKEQLTLEAMRRGDALIYSGRIFSDDLVGIPDILRKETGGYIPQAHRLGVSRQAKAGDTKRMRESQVHYGVRLALYIDLLERPGRSVWSARKLPCREFLMTGPNLPGVHQAFHWSQYEQLREPTN